MVLMQGTKYIKFLGKIELLLRVIIKGALV